jgi:nickel-dependent lactate racemase
VAIIPPDFTRLHSKAGEITQIIFDHYRSDISDIMPALGTHAPMTDEEIATMFGNIPRELFRVHDWRNDVVTIGEVPADMVAEASAGHLNQPWPAQINKLFWEGKHDLIFSVGQVVPHEVMVRCGCRCCCWSSHQGRPADCGLTIIACDRAWRTTTRTF